MAKFDLASSHPRPILKSASRPEGFTPVADLLAEMGLTPRAPAAEAPLVAPHGADAAEFSPPRPLRRDPTRFAHLRTDAED